MAEAKHSLAFLLGLLRDRKFLEITSATGCRWRSAEGPILMKGGRFNVYRWAYNCRNLGRAELLWLNVFRHLKISVAEVVLDLFIQTDERLNPRINQGVRSRGRFWKNLHMLKPGFSTVKLER